MALLFTLISSIQSSSVRHLRIGCLDPRLTVASQCRCPSSPGRQSEVRGEGRNSGARVDVVARRRPGTRSLKYQTSPHRRGVPHYTDPGALTGKQKKTLKGSTPPHTIHYTDPGALTGKQKNTGEVGNCFDVQRGSGFTRCSFRYLAVTGPWITI